MYIDHTVGISSLSKESFLFAQKRGTHDSAWMDNTLVWLMGDCSTTRMWRRYVVVFWWWSRFVCHVTDLVVCSLSPVYNLSLFDQCIVCW